jgi:predicted short-subunit dehydrogenase-like oxidoreductase (DUF2520 family)
MTPQTLGFIGAGTLAHALAPALDRAGHPVVAVASRTFAHAQSLAERLPAAAAAVDPRALLDHAQIVFLTVPDRAIEPVCRSLPWRPGLAVVHCSGALSLDPLAAAQEAGAETGAFHPLQTLADPQRLSPFRGVAFAVDASSPTLRGVLAGLAHGLEGTAETIAGADKPLYHAGAAMASNYLVTLLAAASAVWSTLGATRADGLRALLPLVRGTLDNLESVGLPAALTGPIARGDADTVKLHLQALRAAQPDLLPLYTAIGHRTVDLALEKGGIDADAAAALHALLAEEEARSG